ncbi:hypothetical protein PanWU01x14_228520 [Parasponia andersonii]|uniref:Uncharacterized protein n=1 Tax=Parasponia andersonii TaxID=3476 RepID=A0A2P5BLM1_PARAD|nr:hypothetical protein PanWU01x14_228520 [Parasponia andersonii]
MGFKASSELEKGKSISLQIALNNLNFACQGTSATDKMHLISDELIGLRKKQLAVRAEIKRIERELEPMKKEINCLWKQWDEIHHRRNEIYFSIFKLKGYSDYQVFYFKWRLMKGG